MGDWNGLVRQYHRLLIWVALRRVGARRAEDVAQETWLRVWKARDAIDFSKDVKPFILRCLQFEICEELRRQHGRIRNGRRDRPKWNQNHLTLPTWAVSSVLQRDRQVLRCGETHVYDQKALAGRLVDWDTPLDEAILNEAAQRMNAA